MLGSFQSLGVLLLLHIVEQGLLCLQQVRDGWAALHYCLIFSIQRRLNKIERVWFRLANSNGSWQLLPGTSSPNTGLPLSGLRLPRTNATIIWPVRHDIVIDWAVKLQTNKQTNKFSSIKTYGINVNACITVRIEAEITSRNGEKLEESEGSNCYFIVLFLCIRIEIDQV